jgi:hypothetical protein
MRQEPSGGCGARASHVNPMQRAGYERRSPGLLSEQQVRAVLYVIDRHQFPLKVGPIRAKVTAAGQKGGTRYGLNEHLVTRPQPRRAPQPSLPSPEKGGRRTARSFTAWLTRGSTRARPKW